MKRTRPNARGTKAAGWAFPAVDTFNAGLRILGKEGKLTYNRMYSCFKGKATKPYEGWEK